MPRVSVVVPTRNRRDTLGRAMHSVLTQTFRDFELIVVDDGSDDGTPELDILRGSEVRCVRLPLSQGVSAARNTGARLASGDFLAFLDSDDEWHPRKLEKQLHFMDRHPGLRISQTEEIWVRGGRRVNPPAGYRKRGGYIFSECLERCMITPSSVLIDADVFSRCGGFNESLPVCEDYDLWLRLTSTYEIGLLDECLLIRHGGHPDQLSGSIPVQDRFRIRGLLDILRRGALGDSQRAAAREVLVRKATIVANGCLKRGKTAEYEKYLKLVECYNDTTY